MDDAQTALLDRAGELLAASTSALGQAVRDHMVGAAVELSILIYLPTIADPNAPDVLRANIPTGWARPAFDVLQLEDYDWAVARQTGARKRALSLVAERLGYPLHEQHYFAGFVLRPEDRGEWRPIVEAAEEARERMIPTIFFWALPQVTRDGLTYFPETEAEAGELAMQAFDDVRFPLALSQEVLAEAQFSTQILVTTGGHERRNSRWSDAIMRFDVGPALRSEQDMAILMAFYRARRGPARAFRLRDPFDHDSANAANGTADQPLGIGDGERSRFALVKYYGPSDDPQTRRITHPDPASLIIKMDDAIVQGWTLGAGGVIIFDTPPPAASRLRAQFSFDVPVRFAEDRLAVNATTFAAGEAVSILLSEVRQSDPEDIVEGPEGVAA
jgi:uncharacterized protein (TIGR02217 family)